jgi:hypothetical protein
LTITPYCVVRSRNVTMADAEPTPMIKSPSVRLTTAREGRVWLRSPCVKSLTGNVRPTLRGALAAD